MDKPCDNLQWCSSMQYWQQILDSHRTAWKDGWKNHWAWVTADAIVWKYSQHRKLSSILSHTFSDTFSAFMARDLGHCLFILAFMLASKVICNNTYLIKLWLIITQGGFWLRKINQMEREMWQYLKWELNINPATLKDFDCTFLFSFSFGSPPPPFVQELNVNLACTLPFFNCYLVNLSLFSINTTHNSKCLKAIMFYFEPQMAVGLTAPLYG